MRATVRTGLVPILVGWCVCSRMVAASTSGGQDTQRGENAWIESKKVFLRGRPVNVTIACHGEAPVNHCQFSWLSREGATVAEAPAGPLASLSRHAPADTNVTCWSTDVPGLGHDLRFGREDGCELVLKYERFEDTVVGCRVAKEWGEWKYATAQLYANERGLLPVDVTARELFALPGREVSLLCNASSPLAMCSVSTPIRPAWFDLDVGTEAPGGRHYYHGVGLDRGECGVVVKNVTGDDAGIYKCQVTTDVARVQRTMKVTVATPPPRPPIVRIDYLPSNASRPTLRATCVHDGGVPSPTVTWTLDDEVADAATSRRRDDVFVTRPGGEWTWPWVDPRHSETLTLSPDDDEGRRLRCVLSHVALDRPLESGPVVISIDYPPIKTEFTIHYEKGITLKATCKASASQPLAKMTWLLGDRVVRMDSVTDDVHGDPYAISQTLYVKLKPQDDARMFRCVVTHPLLERPIERAERVWYKPFDPLAMGMREEVVALPGNDANMSCVSPAMEPKYLPKIDTCSFKLFGRQTTAYFHSTDRLPRDNRAGYRFHGRPMAAGGCGITLERVTEDDNGRILCRIEGDNSILFRRYITVVVAHPPSRPVLDVTYVGPVIWAKCAVETSRPPASIAWMLGEDVIRQEAGDDSPVHPDDRDPGDVADDDDDRDPYDIDGRFSHTHKACRSSLLKAPITQKIAWRLEPEDNGKLLRCVVTHPILAKPLEDNHEIMF